MSLEGPGVVSELGSDSADQAQRLWKFLERRVFALALDRLEDVLLDLPERQNKTAAAPATSPDT